MKNFPIIDKETGREYWISRSVAILGIVKAIDKNGNKYILAEQRGSGTPDPEYIGCWCLPCGYLDFDETCKQGISREVREETGVNIHPENFELIEINDVPYEDKRQNITFRFRVELEGYIDDFELTDRFSETNEVMNIKWINLKEINNYKWAFNHEKIIKKYYS
jgi:ADP-ribose pyrophosphatase YjhB (NUDIX family)